MMKEVPREFRYFPLFDEKKASVNYLYPVVKSRLKGYYIGRRFVEGVEKLISELAHMVIFALVGA